MAPKNLITKGQRFATLSKIWPQTLLHLLPFFLQTNFQMSKSSGLYNQPHWHDFSFQTLPALRSFCVFCGVGILMVFSLQCTFFLGCFVLDQVRKTSYLAVFTNREERRSFNCQSGNFSSWDVSSWIR